MGGKLEQVIPRERLNHDLLLKELKRIEDMGVHFVTDCPVDAERFADCVKARCPDCGHGRPCAARFPLAGA